VEDYRELMEHATVPPTVNQIEVNLFPDLYTSKCDIIGIVPTT
jgi:hypothetical protein